MRRSGSLQIFGWLQIQIFYFFVTYIIDIQSGLLSGSFCASARFQICSNSFARPVRILWKLSGAGINDGLNLLFGLFGNRNMSVKVLIHKQSDKHLQISWQLCKVFVTLRTQLYQRVVDLFRGYYWQQYCCISHFIMVAITNKTVHDA